MRLFNTLTGRLDPFEVTALPVRIYVCGVTPYDTTHLGHAFVYIAFDVLIRLIEHDGAPVQYVRNVTDVDDPLFERARQTNEDWQQIVRANISRFHDDMQVLGARPPDVEPYVSTEIDWMISLIKSLEAKGHTYAIGDRLYFRVRTFPGYGALGDTSREYQIQRSKETGNDPDLAGKEDPLDFLLWQPSQPDEPAWESPWGMGRPGWHIECSAMSLRYLGPQIDIHGGGQDLIFPHHENEIAQTEAFTAVHPFVRYWVHNGWLFINEEKMSKSLGNIITIREVLGKYGPDGVRIFVLSSYYRSPLNFSEESLESARAGAERLRLAASLPGGQNEPAADPEPYRQRFIQAMDDDLNTPAALAALFDLAREINRARDERRRADEALAVLHELAGVLGLTLREPEAPSAAGPFIELLVHLRNELRARKQFEVADEVRSLACGLAAHGFRNLDGERSNTT